MQPPELPADEPARLAELYGFGILDSPSEPGFDEISELARSLAGTEIAIITLVDADRQWFKSCVGLAPGVRETPRQISFCGHTILQRDPLIVSDTLEDPRFADNPLVSGDLCLRFYAGFPLISTKGYALGSLCVCSREPRQLSPQQIGCLQRLASLTMQHLQLLRQRTGQPQPSGSASERLPPATRQGLASLEQLIGRDQMMQTLELLFAIEDGCRFSLLRCCFRDYERVNATLGGLVAEEYINEGARRLLAASPRSATAARFGDAELVLLLPHDAEAEQVTQLAERILGFCNQSFRHGAQALPMALAIGIAICDQSYANPEALLADTSMAVRLARRSSSSRYRFIDVESRVMARESYRLESELREALVAKQLEPYLQPIVDLTSGAAIGFEALARWPRGEEVLEPSQILSLLAEAGLTGELDLLIIEKSLAALPLLARPIPQRPMTLSLNLSGLLLEDDDLRRRLLTLLDDNPRPPGWSVQMELVEDVFRDGGRDFEHFLHALVERGIAITIDDFGTGYSSLARLVSMPIQGAKLDRSFVHAIDAGGDSHRTLLLTVMTMMRDLRLEVTAEGVESVDQRNWLLARGVQRAQGYLFHRPMPISEAIALLQQLDYRPGAIPVDPRRLQALRQRRRRGWSPLWWERRGGGQR
ncbi:MAG: EAL domain-containing protein [Synechococcaceae cyanobacterium]|jgi:EAL domain-containing protein (putative c-di-GMP-specific phosphodiesterase class I)/GGDEF domain-containing protein